MTQNLVSMICGQGVEARADILVQRPVPTRTGRVRHFEPFARHEQAVRQAGIRAGTLAVMACKASSGLTVAQTLLVAIRR